MTVEQHQTPVCDCLNCGAKLGGVTGFGKPKPGDATLCLYCGHFMIFRKNLTVRQPTQKEIREWAGRKELVGFSSIVDEFKRQHK